MSEPLEQLCLEAVDAVRPAMLAIATEPALLMDPDTPPLRALRQFMEIQEQLVPMLAACRNPRSKALAAHVDQVRTEVAELLDRADVIQSLVRHDASDDETTEAEPPPAAG